MLRKLGRGLDSLIEETRATPREPATRIPTNSIRPNPHQPRREFDEETIRELAESIREHGLLQPILVRPADKGYELVAGERRFRACTSLGLEEIPATVRDVDDDRMLEIALVENLQREDLNPIEKAHAYERYVAELSLTHEQAAARLGKNRSTITNQLRLLELPADLQAMVSRGTLSMGHARSLLGVTEPALQRRIASRVEKEGISVREVEKLARETRDGAPSRRPPAPPTKSAYLMDLERRLRERFATKARIDGGKERGKLVLEYYSMEELSRLLDLLLPE
jgi:ParB family chromosome partitioning protein